MNKNAKSADVRCLTYGYPKTWKVFSKHVSNSAVNSYLLRKYYSVENASISVKSVSIKKSQKKNIDSA